MYTIAEPSTLLITGVTDLRMCVTSADDEMITVPGEYTTSPSGYFWVIDRESLPVGILMPRAMEKSLAAFTALYKRASSPGFLQGHIQLALSETPLILLCNGAQ